MVQRERRQHHETVGTRALLRERVDLHCSELRLLVRHHGPIVHGFDGLVKLGLLPDSDGLLRLDSAQNSGVAREHHAAESDEREEERDVEKDSLQGCFLDRDVRCHPLEDRAGLARESGQICKDAMSDGEDE